MVSTVSESTRPDRANETESLSRANLSVVRISRMISNTSMADEASPGSDAATTCDAPKRREDTAMSRRNVPTSGKRNATEKQKRDGT